MHTSTEISRTLNFSSQLHDYWRWIVLHKLDFEPEKLMINSASDCTHSNRILQSGSAWLHISSVALAISNLWIPISLLTNIEFVGVLL